MDIAAAQREIDALPEHLTGEVLGGSVVTTQRGFWRQAVLCSNLKAIIWEAAEGHKKGVRVLSRLELHLGRNIIVPDLVAWEIPLSRACFEGAEPLPVPNWVLEVERAENEAVRNARYDALHEAGVKHLWVADWDTQSISTKDAAQYGWTNEGTFSPGDVISCPLTGFDDIELDEIFEVAIT
ncbi:MAG: Uma2 family endonuclease [Pseudomonadota bacterium]